MELVEVMWYGFPAALLVSGVVQVIKNTGFPAKFCGALALLLGIVGGIGTSLGTELSLVEGAVSGIFVGLTASGAYSAVKNSTEVTDYDS